MLGEGFLRVLRYREERRAASASKPHRAQTQTHCLDSFGGVPSGSNSGPYTLSTKQGPNKEELGPAQSQGLSVASHASVGLSIPGCSPVVTLSPDLSAGLDTCSLLQHYPDLRLGHDTGELGDSDIPLRGTVPGYGSSNQMPISGAPLHSVRASHWEQQRELAGSVPDQGYLVMGGSITTSLDLPGSGLEPMSNSVLNGLLEKQLEEVYLQHLTDSLARCHSHLGNSLLHGLVPPPQPSSQLQGPDSLEAGLEGGPAGYGGRKISYLSTQNLAPCSSNFSSPVLRISEAENAPLQ